MKFLLVTWDGGGVITAELGLAAALVRRGHQVTVLADDTVEGDARRAGLDFAPWVTAPQARARDRHRALVRDWETRNRLGEAGNIGKQLFFRPAAAFADDTLAAIERIAPDVIIVHAFLGGALAAAESSGLPVAAVAPNVNMLRSPDTPPLGGGFRPARNRLGRWRDAALRTVTDRTMDITPVNVVRQRLGLGPVQDLDEMVRRADRVLLLTSAAFDFDATPRRANVVYGGIPLPAPATAAGGPWTPPWPDDGRRSVLVALGSTYQQQEQVLDRVIEALGRIDCHAIVTLGPALADHQPAAVAPDVHIAGDVPHGEVLPHVDLCVTHGGHGTVVRTLAAGVPMLVVPLGRDQADNAVRAEAMGAALRLSRRASVDRLAAALARGLLDRGLRQSARAAAARLASDMGARVAIEELESLGR